MISQYNKEQFQKTVLQGLPDGFFATEDSYFILPGIQILSGFLAAAKESGVIEIQEFSFPLFDGMCDDDNKVMLHSTYCKKFLPVTEQLIDFDNIKAEDEVTFNGNLARVFLDRVEPKINEVPNRLDLESFYVYLSQLKYPELAHVQKAMGFTQILLGNDEKAFKHLTVAIEGGDEHLKKNCQAVFDLISQGRSDGARTLLLENSQKLQQKLTVGI